MGIHGLIDRLALAVGARFMRKYFRESHDSPPFEEHLGAVEAMVPTLRGEGEYEVSGSSLVGVLDGGLRLAQWQGSEYPSVIYHHGAAEVPHDHGFRRLFTLQKKDFPANLFLVRAPFHRSLKEFQHGIRTLSNFLALLAFSVNLVEKTVQLQREQGVPRVLVAGTSMGGFITNLHYIHFHTADIYTPLLAGLAANDTFLRSAYSQAVAPEARADTQVLERLLDFSPGFAQRDGRNLFPLLAREDQIIRYEPHRASYGECPVASMPRGHTTGALSYRRLRQHILGHLQGG